ncbi:MAG: bacteriophage holin [Candidatus Thorarchaeota archaeon]
MNLSKRALGLSLGLIWGFTVLISTWWLLIVGSHGKFITHLKKFYFGYSFSWFGGIVGLLWGFVDGFICGFLIALLYNIFNKGKTDAA